MRWLIVTLAAAVFCVGSVTAASAKPEADGKALLLKFLDPAVNRAELTAQLKPTDADIRAVYGEPLGTKLIQSYGQLYVPGTAIGPNAGQTELLYTYATTAQLKAGAPVASEFPGGYAKVTQYMIKDVPIIRFKFVKSGETLGMAYDGLIYVNGRWVFMPKPWRVLD